MSKKIPVAADVSTQEIKTLRIAIDGMTCAACATRVEKVLNKKPAISHAAVNFASETATVQFDGSLTNRDEILAWVGKAGYTGNVLDDDKPAAQDDVHALPVRLLILWGLSLPFWLGMLGMMAGTHALMPPVWVQFVLATVVQGVFGLPFYKGAYASIKGGLANMDVLVSLGTTAIWLYSSYAWLTVSEHIGHSVAVYFEAAVMVLAFVSLGKYLEARTKKNSLNSLSLLMALVPKYAQLKTADGYRRVAVDKLAIGDVLLAKMGDRVAIDGQVVLGAGFCDESHLTGESLPVSKAVGDKLLAGAMVASGSMEYQVATAAKDTQLSQMMNALAEAQGSKANIARVADRVAAVFVPVVVLIAVATFVGNWLVLKQFDESLMRAVAVLVIACPCALGLATPAAIMAGMGVAARHGVWFKDAASLEQAGEITAVCFDKTGTLTKGVPSIIAHALPNGKMSYDELLAIMAAVEQYANHPLGTTIIKAAQAKNLTLPTVASSETVVGQGVQAVLADGRVVKVGKSDFANYPKSAISQSGVWQTASLVAMAIDDVPVLLLALADDVRADARALVQELHAQGLTLVMLSGDKSQVAQYVGEQLAIDKVFGDLSATDKVNKIKELQQTHKVAMVGDGINDAAAMAQANASFAVAGATDVAAHTASARLTSGALSQVSHARIIAKKTLGNIHQNLFFAFFYNILGIPLAAFGLLNPMIAAAMMAASSICVLGNALRLSKLKINVDFT
ncbi:MAG: cation-translocating P-type ATPase [Moraxella sp.]|nr:cation-translocating P-type ATPase [Moraxella sp.]